MSHYCPTCGEFIITTARGHQCPPQWNVVLVGIDDENDEHGNPVITPKTIYAWSASDAAEKRVELWNIGDWGECQANVVVYDADMGNPLHFEVMGEPVMQYTAHEDWQKNQAHQATAVAA